MNTDANVYCKYYIHSLKFCGFNQFDILVALKPQFGLQACDQVDVDMENKGHRKWSDAEKPKTLFLECWNSSGTFQP